MASETPTPPDWTILRSELLGIEINEIDTGGEA